MEGTGYSFEQSEIDTSIMLTAAITSLQKDEYIPPAKCEEFLSQIEGVLAIHQEFVSSHFLPDIDTVKSLLPLDRKILAGTVPPQQLQSFPMMMGAGGIYDTSMSEESAEYAEGE